MPGPEIKNWDVYHAIRKENYSKKSAAKIANAQAKKQAVKNLLKNSSR